MPTIQEYAILAAAVYNDAKFKNVDQVRIGNQAGTLSAVETGIMQ
jgi:hypothetical protein